MEKLIVDKNCSIVDNKTYLYLDVEDVSNLNLKKIGQGTEADIYYFNKDMLLKVYKKNLIDDMPEIYNEERIKEISRKKRIDQNSLPIGPLYLYGDFIGCTICNHKHTVDLNGLNYVIGLENKVNILIDINEKLHQLEQNKMYYVGLKSSNILLEKLKTPTIVGMDGNSIRLSEDKNNYYSFRMYCEFFNLIVEKLFNYVGVLDNQISIDEVFEPYNIPKELRKEFYKENYNYEVIKQFLYYIKDNVSYIKKIKSNKKLTLIY